MTLIAFINYRSLNLTAWWQKFHNPFKWLDQIVLPKSQRSESHGTAIYYLILNNLISFKAHGNWRLTLHLTWSTVLSGDRISGFFNYEINYLQKTSGRHLSDSRKVDLISLTIGDEYGNPRGLLKIRWSEEKNSRIIDGPTIAFGGQLRIDSTWPKTIHIKRTDELG